MNQDLKDELSKVDGIKLWDRSCSRAVVNMLTPALAKRLDECRGQRPELFGQDEDTLRRYFKENLNRGITATENQLRIRFWQEYEMCVAEEKPQMDISRVVSGVCSVSMFYSYVTRPETIAWLLCVPLSYEAHLDDLLNYGAAKMREIMARDSSDDIKLSKLQFDIYLAAENRRLGALTQKSLHLHAPVPGGPQRVQSGVESIGDSIQDKRIEELRNAQKRKLTPAKNGRFKTLPLPPVDSIPADFSDEGKPTEEDV